MTFDADQAELAARTAVLLTRLEMLDDALATGPSLLPGWSRAHVLAHLARNADGIGNLLHWARTGVETPMYGGAEERAADIERSAAQTPDELRTDVADSAAAVAHALAELPPEAAGNEVSLLNGTVLPATRIVWLRLREVEIHHVDLDLGYTTRDWPRAFRDRLLAEIADGVAARPDSPALRLAPSDGEPLVLGGPDPLTVSGDSADLATWLLGRGPGDGLRTDGAGGIPAPPSWM